MDGDEALRLLVKALRDEEQYLRDQAELTEREETERTLRMIAGSVMRTRQRLSAELDA